MKRNLLFIFIPILFSSSVYAYGGYGSEYYDPKTGVVDTDKMFGEYKTGEMGAVDRSGDEVRSIRKEDEDRIVLKMEDGRQEVYERDPFHPEKGWQRKY